MTCRRNRARGVTLIELLIAITLLSLLATGLLFAMRIGLNAMESANRRVMTNRRTLGAHRILEQQVAGFVPAFAQCRAPGAPGGPRVPLFQGTPNVIRFVSTYSLQESSRGYPRLLEYFVIPGDNNEGVRLVVNETLYTSSFSAGELCLPPMPDPVTGIPMPVFRPPEPRPGTFVLADRLAYCRFWFEEALPPQTPAQIPPKFVPVWAKPGLWPRSIRIEMAPLQPDPSRVQPMSFAAPIRVTRQPGDQSDFLD
jgi:prepilin-type N-terminal cleavage/methylation domain-containing protein